MKQNSISRHIMVKSSVLGLITVAVPHVVYAKEMLGMDNERQNSGAQHDGYPAIPLDIASEVVGVSHFNRFLKKYGCQTPLEFRKQS